MPKRSKKAAAESPLDFFGRFVVENLRDVALERFDMLAAGKMKDAESQALQKQLKAAGKDAVAMTRAVVASCVETAVHDFLFKLQEQADFDNDIQVSVRGTNVVEASDGLHGELFGRNGWYARFSKYGAPADEA